MISELRNIAIQQGDAQMNKLTRRHFFAKIRFEIMKNYWWKVLSIVILVSVILIGLLVPLKPGLTVIKPFSIETGQQVEVSVHGYNTFFEKAKDLNAWLKLDEVHALEAIDIRVVSDQELMLKFDIPEQLPVPSAIGDASLVINSDVDGAFVRPSALAIRQIADSKDRSEAAEIWKSTPIDNLYALNSYRFPYRNILSETIRNTYFHIPMWFGMILIFLYAAILSVKFLRKPDYDLDDKITALIGVGILFGVMGIVTGAIWARFTWGDYWSGDIKQNMSLICLLIYSAYFMLRASMNDAERRGRVSAAYSLFAFVTMIPLLFIIPRMQDSLHPGSGGNPALGGEDLDNTMRLIFYPAIIGWTLLGLWMAQVSFRLKRLIRKQMEIEMNG